MAKTILLWGPTGLATPTCKLMAIATPTTVAETITLTEHATVKRAYTGTVTVTGEHFVNLLSAGAFVGGGTITIGGTDAATYSEGTYPEPGQGTPAATTTLAEKVGYLFKAWRNRSSQTSTAYKLYNDDATTVDQKAVVSDDNTTYESGEKATGP